MSRVDKSLPQTLMPALEQYERTIVRHKMALVQYTEEFLSGLETRERGMVYGSVMEKPIFAVGGLSGSGKGYNVKRLQAFVRQLGYNLEITTAGQIMRGTAENEGFTLKDFLDKCRKEPEYGREMDLEIDRITLELAITKGGIFEGRLVPLVVGGWGYKVVIETDDTVRARRIANDPKREEHIRYMKDMGRPPTVDEVLVELNERDRKDRERYMGNYGLLDFMQIVRKTADISVDNSEDVTPQKGEDFELAFARRPAWRKLAVGTTLWLQKNGFL